MAPVDDTDLEGGDPSSSSPLLPPTALDPPPPSRKTREHSGCTQCIIITVLLSLLFAAIVLGGTHIRGGKSESEAWPTFVGFEGPTPTGSEPLAAATGYPSNFDTHPLYQPTPLSPAPSSSFNVLHKLGNLAPWRSVDHGLGMAPSVPDGCEIEQVHLLHRFASLFQLPVRDHGARYPTLDSSTTTVGKKFSEKKGWKATGALSFLNDFKYRLGAEILTPFGREQLFSLGAGFRVKYGQLLDPDVKPVFRTESQDRMLKSALNFAAGFFGIPFEDQYHQLITIEAEGFNNTLSPYMTCKNAYRRDLNAGPAKMREWIGIYLKKALPRLQSQIRGLELTLADLYNFQLLCAYETVALGASEFCALFTEEEWEGFEYSLDLQFWYGYSFGHPTQAAIGLGWVQEWLARVTETPIAVFDSTTNASYHTPEYFPLGKQNIFVDATHDTIISAVIVTLNFSSFTSSGPLPSTHIPANRSFDASKISPFAANLQSQILSCTSSPSSGTTDSPSRYVRWLLNDGVVPLDGIPGCEPSEDGLCALPAFVTATERAAASIDWAYDCLAPYSLGDAAIMNGRPHSE